MVPSMSISSGGGKGFTRPRPNPELKRLRRTAFTALFDPVRVRRSEEAFADETALLAEYLVGESERNGSAEIRPAVRRAVINCVLRYAFSTRIPHRAGEIGIVPSGNSDRNPPQGYFDELVHVTDKIWARLTSTQTTMADLLATPDVNSYELRRLVRRRDQIIREIVGHRQRQRRKDGDTHLRGEHGDMLDALLGAGLPESDIHYTLVDLFVAGVNTVSTQLEWLLLLLAKNISIQEQARQSLVEQPSSLSNQKNGKEEGKGRENNFNNNNTDTKSSSSSEVPPYVRAVIKEVLRSKPPLLLPRKAVEESSTIGGYSIPKGTTIFVNNYALTHDDKWWNQPYAFRPERWLEEESTSKTGIDACKFIPYSIGRRVCPGSKLADAELLITTKVLLQNVKWKKSSREIDLSEDFSLTLSPRVSQSLCFERV